MILSLITSFLIFFGECTPGTNGMKDICELETDLLIHDELERITGELSDGYDWDKIVFVLREGSDSLGLQLKVSVFYKDDFSWYLTDKQDQIIGYFLHRENIVLVFGRNSDSDLFAKESNCRTFDFLTPLPEVKEESDIPKPPIIFEPTVWIYSISDSKLELRDKGMFSILN